MSLLLIILVLPIILVNCKPKIPEAKLGFWEEGEEEPTTFFDEFRMVSTRKGKVEWEYLAETAKIYEKKNLAKSQKIKIIYKKDNGKISTLTAKKGILKTDTSDMLAEGDVVLISSRGVRLETQLLNWDNAKKEFFTDLPVKLFREKDTLTGIGLKADSELKKVKILSQVEVKVHSVDLGKDEED